jgi:hypothetical protein
MGKPLAELKKSLGVGRTKLVFKESKFPNTDAYVKVTKEDGGVAIIETEAGFDPSIQYEVIAKRPEYNQGREIYLLVNSESFYDDFG